MMNSKMFLLKIIFFSSNIFSSSLEEKIDNFFSHRKNISVLIKSMAMNKINFSKHLNSNKDQKEIFEEGAGLLADTINLKNKKAARKFILLAGLVDHELVENALSYISLKDLEDLTKENIILGGLELKKQKQEK